MSDKLAEAAHKLGLAKGEYRRLLRGVDGLVRAAVAQDPAHIPAAEALRATYGQHDLELAPLAALEQPAGRPEDMAPQVADEIPEPVAEPVETPEAREAFAQDIGRPEEGA